MAEFSDRCSFEFDPAVWEREHGGACFVDPDSGSNEDILTENSTGNMVWRCPHKALDNDDECLFHVSADSDAKPDAETVATAFVEIANGEREALDGDGPRPAQFIDAEFQALDLDAERVGNGELIDLRHAEIESAEWEVGTVEAKPLDMRGVGIRGRWECKSVTFDGDVQFDQATFRGDAWFPGAEFTGSARFNQVEFIEDIWFSGAEFNEYARFEQTKFGRKARFEETIFTETAHFKQAEFSEDTVFRNSEFDRHVWFNRAVFSENALFSRAKFSRTAGFEQIDFGRKAEFFRAEFGSGTRFKQAEFSGTADFEEATFSGDTGFPRAEFSKEARFNQAEFDGYAGFERTTFGMKAGFEETDFIEDAWFKEARIRGTAQFEKADFGGTAWFKEITFIETASFNQVIFAQDAGFSGAEFNEAVWFEQVKFGGKAIFPGAEFGGIAQFKLAEFSRHAWFKQAEFEDGAIFTIGGWYPISQFQADADFTDITADEPLRFVDAYGSPPGRPYTFLGEVSFKRADIPGAEFSDISFCEAPVFKYSNLRRADLSNSSLEGATFEGANLSRADLSKADLSGARLNDTLLSQASLYHTDLTNAWLYGAQLDGAQISDHTDFGIRDQLGVPDQGAGKRSSAFPFRGPRPAVRYDERNPEYDRFADNSASGGAEGDEIISDHTRAAAVYAEIETVAEANADSQLASRCYRWRKDMQRKRYWSDEGGGTRREPIRWVRSWLANVFVRYGESPLRVTSIAGLIILSCAVLYSSLDLIEYTTPPSRSAIRSVAEQTPETAVTFLDAVYFSTLTFSTLGMGTFQPSGQLGRAVAIFETLSGVVLLALLVFVFGRRATR